MLISKIKLHKYKPFLHGGPTTLTVDLLENVVPIIGNNGSGKSSLMRALTVFPPISSDFEIGGYKEIEVSHNGSEYMLRSEFAKAKGTHNFFCDGVDLNESKNSTAQISLCESHFGMSNLIRDLTSGNLNISKITRAARKDILLACYPTDLSFVLDHHKRISSKLRAIKSNLKMMNVRLQEVSDKLMEEEEYGALVKFNTDLTEFKSNIDSWMYRFTQEISIWKQHESYRPNTPLLDDGLVRKSRLGFMKDFSAVSPDVAYDKNDAKTKVDVLKSSLQMRKEILDTIETSIDVLVKEIDEYADLAGSDIQAEIDHTRKEVSELEAKINAIELNSALPIVSVPNDIDEVMLGLNEHIVTIHGCGGTVLSTTATAKLESDLIDVNREGQILSVDIKRLSKQGAALETRVNREKTMSYNSNCALPCQLKSNFDKVVGDLKGELAEITKTQTTLEAELTTLRIKRDKLVAQLEHPRQMLPIVIELEKFYTAHSWTDVLATDMEQFVVKLNTNATTMFNQISAIFTNSRNADIVGKLTTELRSVKYRLQVLVETKLPTKQLISKGLITKRASLKELQYKHVRESASHISLEFKLKEYSKLVDVQSGFIEFADKTMECANHTLVSAKIALLQGIVKDLSEYKSVADTKQNNIAVVLRDQSHLRIRLNEEIQPTLKSLMVDKKKLEIIEAALSPSTGIPHLYMTRFINSVFRTANEHIKTVWNYNLQFVELSESHTLDFNFPIRLYDSSGVKDVSMCSKGEQEMIDLAFSLALCIHMDVGSKFPIRLDEADSGLSLGNRGRLNELLSSLVRQGYIKQLVFVNHDVSVFSSFANSQIICLNPEGIAVPTVYNEGVVMS